MSDDWVDRLPPDERTDWDEFVHHFRTDTLRKMDDSAFVASLVPRERFDVKFALETGTAIMLGKPIILIVMPGAEVPGKLALVADEIVECDMDTEAGREQVAAAIKRMSDRLAEES